MAQHTGPGRTTDEAAADGPEGAEAPASASVDAHLGSLGTTGHDLADGDAEGRAEAAQGLPTTTLDLGPDGAPASDPGLGTLGDGTPWGRMEPVEAAASTSSSSRLVAPVAEGSFPNRVPDEAAEPPDLHGRDPSPEDMPPLLRPQPEGTVGRSDPLPAPSAAEAPAARVLPEARVDGPPAPPRRGGGVGALLLGGVVAATLGFGAAWLARERLATAPDPALAARVAALEERASEPDAETAIDPAPVLADLERRVAALEDAPEDAVQTSVQAPDPVEVAALREDLAAARTGAEAIEARVAALEAGPAIGPATDPAVEAPPVDVAALRAEVAEGLRAEVLGAVEPRLAALEGAQGELGQRVEAAEGAVGTAREGAERAAQDLAAAEAEAAEAARRAQAEGALIALSSALDAGEPLAPALAALPPGLEVPQALTAVAEGAPTIAGLRDAFPEAARAGLAAAREAGLTEDGGGVAGFLREQLSLRSTAPRAGEDPDAILSRAEAALDQGRLGPALSEVGALPEPSRAAMADWIAQAEARAGAEAALASLRAAPDATADAAPDAAPTATD